MNKKREKVGNRSEGRIKDKRSLHDVNEPYFDRLFSSHLHNNPGLVKLVMDGIHNGLLLKEELPPDGVQALLIRLHHLHPEKIDAVS